MDITTAPHVDDATPPSPPPAELADTPTDPVPVPPTVDDDDGAAEVWDDAAEHEETTGDTNALYELTNTSASPTANLVRLTSVIQTHTPTQPAPSPNRVQRKKIGANVINHTTAAVPEDGVPAAPATTTTLALNPTQSAAPPPHAGPDQTPSNPTTHTGKPSEEQPASRSRRRHLVPAHVSTRALLRQKTDRPTSFGTSNSLSHTTQVSDEAYMQDMLKKYATPPSTTPLKRRGVRRSAAATKTTLEPRAVRMTSHDILVAAAAPVTCQEPCVRRLHHADAALGELRREVQGMLNQGKSRTPCKAARAWSPTRAELSAIATLPFNAAPNPVPALPRALELQLVTVYEQALARLSPATRDRLVHALAPQDARAVVLDCVKHRLARVASRPVDSLADRAGGKGTTTTPSQSRTRSHDDAAALSATPPSSGPLLGGYRHPHRRSQRRHLQTNDAVGTRPPLEDFCTAFATEVRAMFVEDCALACLRPRRRSGGAERVTDATRLRHPPHARHQHAIRACLHRLLPDWTVAGEESVVEGMATMLEPWLASRTTHGTGVVPPHTSDEPAVVEYGEDDAAGASGVQEELNLLEPDAHDPREAVLVS